MGCMCMECKFITILRDNHDNTYAICTRRESEKFLHSVDIAFDDCDFGEVDDEDDEEMVGED